MNDITYTYYNKVSLAVRGDREKYQDFVKKSLGGKWNPRIKDGAGWIVPIENEEKLKAFINSKREDRLDIISSVKKSRKEQSKYKRAISKSEEIDNDKDDNNNEDDNKNETTVENLKDDTIIKSNKKDDKDDDKDDEDDNKEEDEEDDEDIPIPMEVLKLLEEEKNRKGEEQFAYYKSFSKNPKEFKKKYFKEDDRPLSSSSNYSESSSDDYPSPETPKPRKQTYRKEEDIDELKEKMKEMQKRMYMMELENKKKK